MSRSGQIVDHIIAYRDRPGRSRHGRDLLADVANEIDRLQKIIDQRESGLQRIVQWSDAYPLKLFPEPDFAKVNEVLKANGITLDAVAASCMRHVVEGVGKIAREALQDEQEQQ